MTLSAREPNTFESSAWPPTSLGFEAARETRARIPVAPAGLDAPWARPANSVGTAPSSPARVPSGDSPEASAAFWTRSGLMRPETAFHEIRCHGETSASGLRSDGSTRSRTGQRGMGGRQAVRAACPRAPLARRPWPDPRRSPIPGPARSARLAARLSQSPACARRGGPAAAPNRRPFSPGLSRPQGDGRRERCKRAPQVLRAALSHRPSAGRACGVARSGSNAAAMPNKEHHHENRHWTVRQCG